MHVLRGNKFGTRRTHSERRDACWVADDEEAGGATKKGGNSFSDATVSWRLLFAGHARLAGDELKS